MDTRIRFLDGWRGLAIFGVLVGHFVGVPGINAARLGVEFFFVLSGRLMAEILFVEQKALIDFFPRRFARIYPTLLIFATAVFAYSALDPEHGIGPWDYLATITLTYNYFSIFLHRAGFLDHIWSLCIEEHLYIVLGCIAAAYRRFRFPVAPVLAGLASLCVLNGALSTIAGGDYYDVYWRSDVRGASILMGAAAFLWLRNRAAPWWCSLVLVLVGLALNIEASPNPLKYSLGTACLAGAVATLPRAPKLVLQGFQLPPLLGLGLVSYSIYLWQQPLYVISHSSGPSIVMLVTAIAAGTGSYFLFERPARRWLNGHLNALAHRFRREPAPTGAG